ncbi:MAG: MFS transporter [Gaiellaceae bacterium]
MHRLLLLTSAVVFFDTLFFAALTPLLPHYAHSLSLGKAGAGVLAASYPAGAFVGAVPSGIVAARLGFKPTVLAGLSIVAVCTALFGIGSAAWQLDAARFLQGLASAFSWTGALGWLVAASPAGRRGRLIGRAFAAAVVGALFGPVFGGIASVAGIGVTFVAIAAASALLVVWAALTPGSESQESQPPRALVRALGDRTILAAGWFVLLPALLFGTLSVLAPLKLSALGFGAVAIGAVFLCSAAVEAADNLALGHMSDRYGTFGPLALGLTASIALSAALPWADSGWLLAVLVACGGIAFGSFYTPGMTLLSGLAERRGLHYGYAFALVNLAWAPGQALGAAGGGTLAHAAGDAVPYLVLSAVCALTLAGLWRSRGSTYWTTRSGAESSGSSSRTTAAA